MASRFWVGGTGSWDQATTTHWSTATGGAGGASVPTIADDVIFDALSGGGTVTVTATAPCLSFNAAAFTGGITLNGGITVTGGGNVALPTAGITIGGVFGITMSGGSASTITFNGSRIGGGLAVGAASTNKVTIADSALVTGTMSHSFGTLDTNNQTCSFGSIVSTGANIRTLTLGTSQITVTAGITSVGLNTNTGTNLTITANTATITFNYANATVNAGAGVNHNGLSFAWTGGGTSMGLQGSSATGYKNLTVTGTASKTDGFNVSQSNTYSGTVSFTGNSATNRLTVFENSGVGSGGSIASGASVQTCNGSWGTMSNVNFRDLAFNGTAGTLTGTSLGDLGGNSGVTFDTPVTQTWSGNTTGSWSNAANWTSRVPLAQDPVLIPGLTSGTITQDMPHVGAGVDFTGSTNGHLIHSINFTVYGSWTYVSTLIVTGNQTFTFSGRGNYTLTCAGIGPSTSSSLVAPGGTLTQLDDFKLQNAAGQLNITNGTWNANGFNMRSVLYNLGASATWNMGSGVITAIGTAAVISGTCTIIPGTSTFVISDTSSSTKTFAGGGKTYNNLTFTGGQGSAVLIQGSNTFNALSVTNPDSVLQLQQSTTTTVSGFTATGSPNSYIYLNGLASTSITAPDIAAYRISGDIDLRSLTLLDTWRPTSTLNIGPVRDDASTNRSYALRIISGGFLNLYLSQIGSGTTSYSSTVAVPITAGPQWCRATWSVSGAIVTFYTSNDGTVWTQLGATVATGALASIWTGGTPAQGLPQASYAPGKYYRVQLYNGIAGTLVLDANFATKTFGANSFTESSSNAATVTINGDSARAGDGRILINSSSAGTAATIAFATSGLLLTTLKNIAAAVSFAGSISQAIAKGLVAGLTPTASLAKRLNRTLPAASLGFVGGLKRTTNKVLSGGLSFSGAIAKIIHYARTLTAGLSFAGSISRQTAHKLTAAGLSFTGSFKRTFAKALSAALSFSGSLARQTRKVLTASLSPSGTLAQGRAYLRSLTAGLSFSGSLNPAQLFWTRIKTTIFGSGTAVADTSGGKVETVAGGARIETVSSGTKTDAIQSGSKNINITSGDTKDTL